MPKRDYLTSRECDDDQEALAERVAGYYGTQEYEQELLEWEAQHERDGDWYDGDPRRCRVHPEIVTSSPDGIFDGLCWKCEQAADGAYDDLTIEEQAADTWGQIEACDPVAPDDDPSVPAKDAPAELPDGPWIDDDIPF